MTPAQHREAGNAAPLKRLRQRLPDGRAMKAVERKSFRVHSSAALIAMTVIALNAPSQVARATDAAPAPLISAPADEAVRTTLVGNVSAQARAELDLGVVPGTLRMGELALVLKRSAAAERALGALLTAQQERTSPSYHRWLTPEQFGSQFGATDSDIKTLSTWLRAHGFSVTGVSRGQNRLSFSGTEAQVEAAFHTPIHYFTAADGERHWANVRDPEIPSAFVPAVVGVLGLHNFTPAPQHHKASQPARAPRSLFNTGTGIYAVGPTDFATIYNVQPLWNKGVTGSGATIAIAAQSDISQSTVQSFWSAFGAAKNQTIKVIVPTGVIDPGETANQSEAEADLDVEVAGEVAQGATIILVPSPSATYSAWYAIDNNLAPIVSISFGECELSMGSAANTSVAQWYQQAAAQGITVLVATGDQGSAACDPGSGSAPAPAVEGLAVNGLASTPYDTAVGGTDFNVVGASVSQYWNATNAAGTLADALSYMPEMAWNSSCANPVLLQYLTSYASVEAICNAPANSALVLVIGGGGGLSSCTAPSGTTPATCAGGYPQPSWQSGVVGIPAAGLRAVPDVSFFASDGFFGTAWIICDYVNTTCNPNGANDAADGYQLVGGTSASTPAMAGVVAMLLQTQVSASNPDGRQGLINPTLYQLAAAEYGSAHAPNSANLTSCDASSGNAIGSSCIFHDVTAGGNAQPCQTGTADCVTQTSGDSYGTLQANGAAAYSAGAGFDLATGLGSLNVSNFVSALWISAAPTKLAAMPGSGTVALSWTASDRAQSYNVYQGSFPGAEVSAPVQTGITGTAVTLTGLGNGKTYFYKVAAVNGGGTSALSNEASATVLPAIPTGLSATPGNGTMSLRWAASAGAASYSIFQGTTSGGESATAVATGVATNAATLKGLVNGKTYFFYVTAVNAGGSSAASGQASATVLPAPPSGLAAVGGNAMVTLTWAASAGAVSYSVYEGTSAGAEGAAPVQANITGTSATVSGLSNGQPYFFKVAAVNKGGASTMSNEASATPSSGGSTSKGGGGGAVSPVDLLLLGALLLIAQCRLAFRADDAMARGR
jgi:subtilase family serine protease